MVKALKSAKFGYWNKTARRWEYTGKTADLAANIAKLRGALKQLDAPKSALSGQQQGIVNAAHAGLHVAVQALAGTGKTTTLSAVALALAGDRPDIRIVYTSYNASVVADARKGRFVPQVTPLTFHSIARRALLQTSYAEKVKASPGGARRPDQWARILDIKEQRTPAGDPVDTERVASLVMATMTKFRNSDNPEPAAAHLPSSLADNPNSTLARAVLRYTRKAWADIQNPDNAGKLAAGEALFFDHDDYLKVWAVSNPAIDADTIMVDEFQDVNPCMKAVILAQRDHAQVIAVGDSQQSIYGFRGAIDALKDFPADITLPLTLSYRFGKDQAAFANLFLQTLGSPLRLEGNPVRTTVIGPVTDEDAVICRTNATGIAEAVTALEAGKRVAMAGDRGDDLKDIARAAKDLMDGKGTKHPELAHFKDWDEVREYANSDAEDAAHLQTFVRIVKEHTPDGLIAILDQLVKEKDTENPPQVTIVTGHGSKGGEWDVIRVADDFHGPVEDPFTGEVRFPDPEERRLQYVVATRARKAMQPGSLSWIFQYEDLLKSAAGQAESPAPAAPARPQAGQADTGPQPEDVHAAPPGAETASGNLPRGLASGPGGPGTGQPVVPAAPSVTPPGDQAAAAPQPPSPDRPGLSDDPVLAGGRQNDADSTGPLTAAEIAAGIRKIIGISLPEYVARIGSPGLLREHRELMMNHAGPANSPAAFTVAGQRTEDDSRPRYLAAVLQEGIAVARMTPRRARQVIPWEELAAWFAPVTATGQAAELTELAAAERALRERAAAAPDNAAAREEHEAARDRLTRAIDRGWAAIMAAPAPGDAALARARAAWQQPGRAADDEQSPAAAASAQAAAAAGAGPQEAHGRDDPHPGGGTVAAEGLGLTQRLVNSAAWTVPEGITIPDGWVIVNAPRPLNGAGQMTWTGDFLSGIFYAGRRPRDRHRR